MRPLRTLLLAALAGCSGNPGDGGMDAGADLAGACHLIDSVRLMPQNPTPGSMVTATVEATSSPISSTVKWMSANGAITPSTGRTVQWTIDPTLAANRPEPVTIVATASADGCPDETVSATATVDWPPAMRTLVIYNPMATGSQDVAQKYADFRQIPAKQLCPIPYADPVTVQSADYDAWLKTAMACADAIGPRVHYIVPVWGVPYKLAGRVKDCFQKTHPITTVSLDAILAYGHDGGKVTQCEPNALFQDADSIAGTYGDYVPFGDYKSMISNDYFLVARIDGADADAAKALVDRTAAAEKLAQAKMLAGTVYVDGNRGLPHPATAPTGSYEDGEWNIIGVETVFKKLGWYPIVTDWDMAEFGTAPAPLTAPDALYYAGWYAFGHYNDVFTWKTGAIGAHLDSCSACDIRGTTDWSAMALRRGITATFGAVNEPYVIGLPCYDQFFKYLTDGASFGEAGYESNPFGGWMVVFVGDPLYRPYAK
jgi:uncharacterized protein (TIGR03790 family)